MEKDFFLFFREENKQKRRNLPWCSVKMLLDPKIRESFGTLGLRLARIDETAPNVERLALGSFTCWLPIISYSGSSRDCYCFDLINDLNLNPYMELQLHNFAVLIIKLLCFAHNWLWFHFFILLSLSHPMYRTFFFFHFFLFNFFLLHSDGI